MAWSTDPLPSRPVSVTIQLRRSTITPRQTSATRSAARFGPRLRRRCPRRVPSQSRRTHEEHQRGAADQHPVAGEPADDVRLLPVILLFAQFPEDPPVAVESKKPRRKAGAVFETAARGSAG